MSLNRHLINIHLKQFVMLFLVLKSIMYIPQTVGIQILDRTGEVLILDGATFSAKTDLIDGTNILPFQARYIALGQSVAGTANADATFKVQYL